MMSEEFLTRLRREVRREIERRYETSKEDLKEDYDSENLGYRELLEDLKALDEELQAEIKACFQATEVATLIKLFESSLPPNWEYTMPCIEDVFALLTKIACDGNETFTNEIYKQTYNLD